MALDQLKGTYRKESLNYQEWHVVILIMQVERFSVMTQISALTYKNPKFLEG